MFERINIEDYIKDLSKYHAHIKKDEEPFTETLLEHMERTHRYLKLLANLKDVEGILDRVLEGLCYNKQPIEVAVKKGIKELFYAAIYFHDLGKINPNFQVKKMRNSAFKSFSGDSKHSILSSLMYMDIFQERIEQLPVKDQELLRFFIYIFAYIMSRHHTYLKSIEEFFSAIKDEEDYYKEQYLEGYIRGKTEQMFLKYGYEQFGNMQQSITYINRSKNHDAAEGKLYVLTRLLYGLLVSCDYYATYDYKAGNQLEEKDIGVLDEQEVKAIISHYKSTPLYKGIEAYQCYKEGRSKVDPFKEMPINALRSELLLEAKGAMLKNKDKNIFYLEAPTGSGKTNTSINLALELLKEDRLINKVFYVFPFNTLIDQTKGTLEACLGNQIDLGIMNGVTPIQCEISDEEISEEERQKKMDYYYLQHLMMQHSFIMMTHVRFFNILFGQSREDMIPLVQLANSLVIIDEVQSYNIKLWKEIIYFFDTYGAILNMKLLIMSATLPRLDYLLDKSLSQYVNLIKDRDRYFLDPLFSQRVQIDNSLLQRGLLGESIEDKLEDLALHIKQQWSKRKPCKILVEVLTTKNARLLYHICQRVFAKEYEEGNIYELTGSDNRNYRQKVIQRVKEKEAHCLLIATQVIEAGVDIDMEIGYKSISFLDAEEQFLGRINRSCNKAGQQCTAYFFDLKEAKNVYRGDFRLQQTLANQDVWQMLREKDFWKFYSNAMELVQINKEACNQNHFDLTLEEVAYLDYEKIRKRMRLIQNDDMINLFINGVEEIEYNGEIKKVIGKDVWEEYKALFGKKDMSFSEKAIELSKVRAKMDYFIYSLYPKVTNSGRRLRPDRYEDVMGDIYYYDDGDLLKDQGKFDREKAYGLFGRGSGSIDFI